MIQDGDSRESELQNLLADERDRCNQYKQIYQALKEKHNKLQDELALIHEKLKEAISQKDRQISSSESTIRKLEARVKEQQVEINSYLGKLKAQDEKKIRSAVLEEASVYYEVKIKDLNVEADKIREQHNSLHFENVVLKCNFESREAEYTRTLERINRQHQGEIEQLQIKIEALEKEKTSPTDTYAVELKSSKREVLQLNSKIKVLLSECDELRAQNEHLSLQTSSLNRTNSKQISDHVTNIRLLESEKQKVSMQKEVLEKELTNAQEHRKALNIELQASKREILSLRNKVEECEQKCRVMTTNLQVEMEQRKSATESELEHLFEEITRLKSELQTSNATLSHERQAITVHEQTLQQNLSATRQQLWKQSRELNQEKDSLKQKMKDIVTEKDNVISHLNQEIQSLKQNLQICFASKAELEKEFIILREQLSGTSMQNEGQNKAVPSKQSVNYEKEIQDLREKIDLLSASGSNEQRQRVLDSAQKSNTPDFELIQLKLTWEQQKLQYQQRLEELESQLRELRSSSVSEKRELEFKVKQYTKQINKLRDRLDLQKTENEELEIQLKVLEKNIPHQVHSQTKNQLVDLQKKLSQYGMLIAAEPSSSKSIPGLSFSDKLLTDIKNIQFQTSTPQHGSEQSDLLQNSKSQVDKVIMKDFPKKTLCHQRKSVKARNKKHKTKTGSPVISSSSDLDLENL